MKGGKSIPALFIPAQGLKPGEKAPCMVHFDGLDVNKEIVTLLGIPQALARRGVSTLVVDNPGVGESLRLRGLHNGPEAEVPAGACVDLLEKRAVATPGALYFNWMYPAGDSQNPIAVEQGFLLLGQAPDIRLHPN